MKKREKQFNDIDIIYTSASSNLLAKVYRVTKLQKELALLEFQLKKILPATERSSREAMRKRVKKITGAIQFFVF